VILGQEADALMRPPLEAAEFLTYLQTDSRAEKEFTDDKLPSPGEIANRIGGQMQFLRSHRSRLTSYLLASLAESCCHV